MPPRLLDRVRAAVEAAVCPRAVAGVAELGLNSPVIIEGEVEVDARR